MSNKSRVRRRVRRAFWKASFGEYKRSFRGFENILRSNGYQQEASLFNDMIEALDDFNKEESIRLAQEAKSVVEQNRDGIPRSEKMVRTLEKFLIELGA